MKAVVAVLAVVIAVTALAADVPEFLRSDAPQSPRLVTKLNEAGAGIDARFAAVESIAGTDGNVVLADGKTLKAIAAGSTNTLITAGKLAAAELSGNVAVARIATALTTPGAIGGSTPAAGAFTTLDASGVATLAGDTRVNGPVRYTGISVNVTNGQELVTTLARGTYLYTPTEVSTNTVADPTASGDWVAFINVGTNDMVVAKAANLALGGATRTLGTYDILVLRAASAAVWVEESFTDNTVGP